MYDIREVLEREGNKLSPAAVAIILRQEGFVRLPRRADDERPARPGPTAAEAADVRQLNLEPRYFRTRFGGLFLFLAFLAEDADRRVFCYANGELCKDQQNDEILRFVEFWKQRTGHLPKELVFDSRLTTYPNLSRLNQMGIDFITLRRRSSKLLGQIHLRPPSAWRQIELENIARAYRTLRVLDEQIQLPAYQGTVRQLTVTDLGHEEPTLLLTNQLRRTPAHLVGRYSQRMIIENSIADGIDFFHMDALSSAVAMKVNCDPQLTLMASSLYRLLAAKVGRGYERAESRHLFRDFIDATTTVNIDAKHIHVAFQKRAHNPLLIAAGFADTDLPIPWLANKRLAFTFG